jgi:hypothetical protein
MYEGYVLWPYRRSALKNRQRWTFGGVYPAAFSRASGGTDRSSIRTEMLVRGRSPRAVVELRFLQVIERLPDGWEEATERRFAVEDLAFTPRLRRTLPIAIAAGESAERRPDGVVAHRWEAIEAELDVRCSSLGRDLWRLSVGLANGSSWPGVERTPALRRTLAAATILVRVAGGELISLADPPARLVAAAAECRNEGLWPVLVGAPGSAEAMLASPIILSDHPEVAPESPGDHFDATEIDQLLVLNVLALTDAEKAEIRSTDPLATGILERAEALDPPSLLTLAGSFRVVADPSATGVVPATAGVVPFGPEADPFAERRSAMGPVAVRGGSVAPGARVRIRPRPGGDAFDSVLAERTGIVESIEEDVDGRLHVAITIEDDPGRDLGGIRIPGHRFFYAPDELEALASPRGLAS